MEITHKQLMRAIAYHKLNVGPIPKIIKVPFIGMANEWQWLDYARYGVVFATEWKPDYHNEKNIIEKYDRCECTESFYNLYVKTVPSDVLHCRTCRSFGKCDIQRKDTEDYCIDWAEKN